VWRAVPGGAGSGRCAARAGELRAAALWARVPRSLRGASRDGYGKLPGGLGNGPPLLVQSGGPRAWHLPHASRVSRRPSTPFVPSRDATRGCETASRRDIPTPAPLRTPALPAGHRDGVAGGARGCGEEHRDGAGRMCGRVQALQATRCWASPPGTANPGEPVTQGRRLGVARRQARMLTRRRTTDSDHACLSGGTAGRWRGSVTPRRRTTSAARLSRLDRTKREPNPRDASQAPMSGAVIPARPRLVLTRPA